MIGSGFVPNDREKQASNPMVGGCSSFPLLLLVLSAVFLLASGETTQPWDLGLSETTQPRGGYSKGAYPVNTGGLSPIFTPQVHYWEEDILRWAADWDLDPNLVAAVMQIESCGDPEAVSGSGAMGLFQVMPYHFKPGEVPYDPATNARRGLDYLSKALAAHNSTRLAFAGYNGGIGTADQPDNVWPSETIRYVYWGLNIYRDASGGKSISPTVEEWLAAGGVSLCEQAGQRLGIAP